MHTIHIIDSLQLSPSGPAAGNELVHLRQGDADGACGPYCVLMALIACGIAPRAQATGGGVTDARTCMGRVWAKLSRWGPLVCEGTDDDAINDLFGAYRAMVITHHPHNERPSTVRRFILKHLAANQPVVVGIDVEDGCPHWVLAIGFEDRGSSVFRSKVNGHFG